MTRHFSGLVYLATGPRGGPTRLFHDTRFGEAFKFHTQPASAPPPIAGYRREHERMVISCCAARGFHPLRYSAEYRKCRYQPSTRPMPPSRRACAQPDGAAPLHPSINRSHWLRVSRACVAASCLPRGRGGFGAAGRSIVYLWNGHLEVSVTWTFKRRPCRRSCCLSSFLLLPHKAGSSNVNGHFPSHRRNASPNAWGDNNTSSLGPAYPKVKSRNRHYPFMRGKLPLLPMRA